MNLSTLFFNVNNPSKENFQALISNRKTIDQPVSNASGELDNHISFPINNPAPTAPDVIDFDGIVLTIKERHPDSFSPLTVGFILSNSDNAAVDITINFRVSLDGGITYPVIANSLTGTLSPKSGSSPSITYFPLDEFVSPQPSTVPVSLVVQVYSLIVTGVVSVKSGSKFTLDGNYKK